MSQGSEVVKGLEGVVAAETALCDLDGAGGRLAYRGYDIGELARQATYEEVAYLLWRGELPTRAQLDGFTAELIAIRPIPEPLLAAFRLLPKSADPMRALQLSATLLGAFDPDAADNSADANFRKVLRLTSQLATAICAHHRIRLGEDPVPPSKDLGHAANVLFMLTGERPSRVSVRAFDASLIL